MATIGPPGVANQESTLPTRAPDTSLYNIQEPPRRHHRGSTEPHKEESQSGSLGPPEISSCHQRRNRSMDLGAPTTPEISEGLHRVGESQLHPHGHWPQQRQYSTPQGLFGGSAPESSSTLYFAGAPSVAMSSKLHIGSTRQHQQNRANTCAPDAAPSTDHGQQPLSTIQTRGSAQPPSALSPR